MSLLESIQAGSFADAKTKAAEAIASDRRAFTQGPVKKWAGMRFRNLFISHAVSDPVAIAAAAEKKLIGKDNRPDRQKISERFIRLDGPPEWSIQMPEGPAPALKQDAVFFCPGLLTGLLPVMAFQEAFPAVESKYGTRILQSDSHPMRSCEDNVADIEAALTKGAGLDAMAKKIPSEKQQAPASVMAICYSKGMPDLLTALVLRPDLRKKIKAIFNWAGAPGGSTLADNIYNSIKDVDITVPEGLSGVLSVVSPLLKIDERVARFSEYRIKEAVRSLTTTERQAFLDRHLDEIDSWNIPIFNITGSTTVMEVPYFQMQGVMELNKYDSNNDMQVTQNSAKLRAPMASDLAMMHGHHWDLSYSPFPPNMRFGAQHLDHPFPKESALTAMIQLAMELGLVQ